MEYERPKKFYAMCSFGKDSLATILLALEHGEPIDEVLFTEVMFDKSRGISGENPIHIKWVYDVAIPKLEAMGIPVRCFTADVDYVTLFHKVRGERSQEKYRGLKNGFPIGHKCCIQHSCKVQPIDTFIRKKKQVYDVYQYMGIAVDEPDRWSRVKPEKNLITCSLLIKYGYTEKMAYDLCKKYDLLSPIYEQSERQGCWFCPNARYTQLLLLRKNFPDLWNELMVLGDEDNLAGTIFKEKYTIHEVDEILDELEYKQDYRNMNWIVDKLK